MMRRLVFFFVCLLLCSSSYKPTLAKSKAALRGWLQHGQKSRPRNYNSSITGRNRRLYGSRGDRHQQVVDENLTVSASKQHSTVSESKQHSTVSESMVPYAVLGIVPIIWGTYTPAVKSLYAIEFPPPGLVFNLLSYIVSFATLSVTAQVVSSYDSSSSSNEDISSSSSASLTGGFELGMWLFFGSTAQVMGIQSTTAIKASILVQLTTVFVPLLESVLSSTDKIKRKLTPRLWLSCLLAFVSVVMISSNGASSLEGLLQFQKGDLLIILSSLFYSMHVIRLGRYAAYVDPISLARSKAFSELVLSICTISFCVFLLGRQEFGEYVNKLWTDKDSTRWDVLGLTVLWNGMITTAATMYCQSYGQKKIRPTEANLIYTSQPVWAILFAYWFLHEQIDPAILPAVGLLFTSIGISVYENDKSIELEFNDIDDTDISKGLGKDNNNSSKKANRVTKLSKNDNAGSLTKKT